MSDVIRDLTPQDLWRHFAGIAAIPRPSKKEERIAQHILDVAKVGKLETERDSTGNIVVRKPAFPGREAAPSVVLQSHIDMVCEKNQGSTHDFDREGIDLMLSDGYIKANGTTLGADNGIGVAAALSVMLDPTLAHGPLELLFTVDEETGLTGASGLRPGFLKSRLLFNLDSEEEGALFVGCAGARDTNIRLPITFESAPQGYVPLGLTVLGLRGGHSGLDIHLGRGNANKLLARALIHLSRSSDIRLAYIHGGSKRNAIAREAQATVYVKGERLKALRDTVDELSATFRQEYDPVEPNFQLQISPAKPDVSGRVFTNADQDKLLQLLHVLPHGVVAMSHDIPGLVETSTNVATVVTEGDAVLVGTSQRSSVASSLNDIASVTKTVGQLVGARVEQTKGYPGWKPNLKSRTLLVTKESYKQLFGKEPAIKAVHAGLECGIIGEKFPGMDMVSFGPTIEGAHSPDERVEIASVQKFWDLLTTVLRNLSS